MKILITFFILLISLSVKSQTLPIKAGIVYYKLEKKIESKTPLSNYFDRKKPEYESMRRYFEYGGSKYQPKLECFENILREKHKKKIDAHTKNWKSVKINLWQNNYKNYLEYNHRAWCLENIDNYFLSYYDIGYVKFNKRIQHKDEKGNAWSTYDSTYTADFTFTITAPYEADLKYRDLTFLGLVTERKSKLITTSIGVVGKITIKDGVVKFIIKDGDYVITTYTSDPDPQIDKLSLGEVYQKFQEQPEKDPITVEHFQLVDQHVNDFFNCLVSDIQKMVEFHELDLD
jgi:hypothetical protein